MGILRCELCPCAASVSSHPSVTLWLLRWSPCSDHEQRNSEDWSWCKGRPKAWREGRKLLKLLSRAVAKSLEDCSILSQVVAPNLLLPTSPWKMLAGFSVVALHLFDWELLPQDVAKPMKKPRIDCIDGCRFALVFPIVVAHFARFSTSNLTALKLLVLQSKDVHLNVQQASNRQGNSTAVVTFNLRLLTQENVLVGGFFVISGYVSAYTTTKLGALGVEASLLNMWHIGKSIRFWLFIQAYSVPISYMAPCRNPKVLKQTNQ